MNKQLESDIADANRHIDREHGDALCALKFRFTNYLLGLDRMSERRSSSKLLTHAETCPTTDYTIQRGNGGIAVKGSTLRMTTFMLQ
jgi:hypothetical protein